MPNPKLKDLNSDSIQAFTKPHTNIAREIMTQIALHPYVDEPDFSKYVQFDAIWDTGATSTCITPKVVKSLGLKPFGKVDVIGISGTEEDADTYFLNAVLRNNLHVPELEVVEVKTISGADVLIGMNLITMGDFAITNYNGKTMFSFQTPSQGKIDFEVGHNKTKAIYVGKNMKGDELCYCDSGKKFKNCHGK